MSEKSKRLMPRVKGRELSHRLEALERLGKEALKRELEGLSVPGDAETKTRFVGVDLAHGFEPPESVDETVARVLDDEEE